MWWLPNDDAAGDVRARVRQLEERFAAHIEAHREDGRQIVWGVGSAPDSRGNWSNELLLVDREVLGQGGVFSEGRRFRARDLIPQYDTLARRLQDWPIRETTLIDVTTRPLAAAAYVQAPDLVQDTGTRRQIATSGLPCYLMKYQESGFLTAGHLVDGEGSRVEIHATGRGSARWIRGTVAHWSDPAATPGIAGFDYAVVTLDDPNDAILGVAHGGPMPAPQSPYAPTEVAMFSGWSGNQYGQISGAINQLGDYTRQWEACWQVGPSYSLTLGDSGSLVMVSDGAQSGKVLGHFVGGSYWHGRRRGLIHQYVQDLRQCLDAKLKNLIYV